MVTDHLDRLAELPPEERVEALDKLREDGLDADAIEFLSDCLDDRFLAGQAGDLAPGLLAEVAEGEDGDRWLDRRLGPWRVVKHLGAGGMGRVFVVERADGEYRLRAALKLLSNPAGTELAQRFQQERQILARLDHPRIARLLDGGTTEDGSPFLVMEYVDGEPIDGYCDRKDLSLTRRLELFLSVCDAVQYAHQNLVVHRDLKPANILVDADGRVKLLDFGIAKLLDAGTGGAVTVTRTQHPFTPEYAAPEQLTDGAITTVTDVYALGVLLYRLLAGEQPFDLDGAGLSEMVAKVCDTDPEPPSRRLDATAQRRVAGDLDAVVLKALAKEPAERYRSVERLAAEIQSYLNGIPVDARIPSLRYRARKFVRRHRAGVAATAAVTVALTAGLGAALWQAHQRDLAAERAEQQALRATAVRDFLVSLFEAAAPARDQGRDLTALQVFDQGALRLTDELDTSPDIKADLLLTLADIALQLGDNERALELVDESLYLRRQVDGADSVQVADALRLRGSILEQAGDYEAARKALRQALDLHRSGSGQESSVAADLVQLASLDLNAESPDAAAEKLERALGIARQVDARSDLAAVPAVIEGQLAMARRQQGRLDEARSLYKRALTSLSRSHGAHHPETVRVRNSLAAVLLHQGNYAAAEEHFQRLAGDNARIYGADHPLTVTANNNLAVTLSKLGRRGEAVPLFRQILDHWQSTAGPDHPHAIITQINLATALADEGHLDDAEPLYEDALPRFDRVFGRESPHVAVTLLRLADVYLKSGRLEEAHDNATEALEIHRRVLPEQHPTMATNQHLLGEITLAAGDENRAAEHFATALTMRTALLGESHPDTVASRDKLAAVGSGKAS